MYIFIGISIFLESFNNPILDNKLRSYQFVLNSFVITMPSVLYIDLYYIRKEKNIYKAFNSFKNNT